MKHQLETVAYLRTCYPDKFGVPRQSGLVPSAWGRVEFTPPYRKAEAVQGIEEFSHLWLLGCFHLIKEEPEGLTVRPPKLGGNERRGVFATRSPFRPNRLSLTVVRLERVTYDEKGAPTLEVSGVDLVDGTPIFDVKPYVCYADSLPEAQSGFAHQRPEGVEVLWLVDPPVGDFLAQSVIEETLSLQPQPAYQGSSNRVYATEVAGYHVEWIFSDEKMKVVQCVVESQWRNAKKHP